MGKKKKRPSSLRLSFPNSLQNKAKIGPMTIDLTEPEPMEPEVIVLDNSEVEIVNFIEQGNEIIGSNIIDLTSPSEDSLSISEIKVGNSKCKKSPISPRSPKEVISDDEIKILGSSFKLRKTFQTKPGMKCKRPRSPRHTKTISPRSLKTISPTPIKISSPTSSSTDSQLSADSALSNKRKSKRISDYTSVSQVCNSLPLSGLVSVYNVLKYYKNVDKVSKRKEKSPSSKGTRHKQIMKRKIKVFEPQNTQLKDRIKEAIERNPSYSRSTRSRTRKILGENNTINPIPHNLNNGGLRPVAIDGSNVAVQHGKGKFSAWGVKICVEFFHKRGHRTIKVFLPQHRRLHFSSEQLLDLNTKSDIVFTPCHEFLDGRRKVPYDDRFIVQYATEFGGVIVSNDNFRDLARENPRWKETIEKRLLMFTWVDDYLMFPVDPLGRSGPTLDEYLRF